MIELNRISKKYGNKRVLSEVSFAAEKSQITCLIGLNGVGKSTILKAIMGLTPINSGNILIDGQPINHLIYEKVAFISDTLTMPSSLKVRETISFMKDFYVNWNGDRARELLAFFKLNEQDRIGDLSKGSAAKLNLLLGLSLNADYVLMDEPFSGIDLFSREQIAKVFTSDLMDERGVIITTHEIQDVEHLIDKVILLDQGAVLKEFNTEDMRLQEGKSVVDVMREVYQA
ncbi:ABC transporter ATP-binding protein [Paenibacillus psychroresistens]|uniref:ABC transporter ATP-binding protein n=1 Tax=Paenibacillus psychroresistens TaxID=1778678 RepID=A0A6B8RRD5_9BACL|nr:ABC transporter ATP-binding protein [Paenibacillus psychroresistens]QGQ98951.1 ABC transporter ATP-binding protein [Paenibacillus psychroresistens]